MDKIRILVVDDHPVVRAGLRAVLDAQHDMVVIGEAADGKEALEQAERHRPDIVLLDLALPGIDGLSVLRRIPESVPGAKVVVLTIHEDPVYLRQVLEAGGAGYVVKRAVDIELTGAIRAVARGERYVHPFMTDALVNIALGKEEAAPKDPGDLGTLSRREREVLHLVAMGHSYQQIAERLCISVKTVETHRARVMEKLGLRSRADLVQYALRHGFLVQEEPPDRH